MAWGFGVEKVARLSPFLLEHVIGLAGRGRGRGYQVGTVRRARGGASSAGKEKERGERRGSGVASARTRGGSG